MCVGQPRGHCHSDSVMETMSKDAFAQGFPDEPRGLHVGHLQTPACLAWRRNDHRNNDFHKLPFLVGPLPLHALPVCSGYLNLLNL